MNEDLSLIEKALRERVSTEVHKKHDSNYRAARDWMSSVGILSLHVPGLEKDFGSVFANAYRVFVQMQVDKNYPKALESALSQFTVTLLDPEGHGKKEK